jgi:hypothetical protein
MQKQFYNFIELHKVQILFFDWFELHYISEHHISYPFASIKHACPVTSRSKTPIWNLTSGPTVDSEHPPLRNIQITHNNQTVDAAPYKLPSDDTLSNTKHIINQNNFTNTNLNTLGKQLTRLEKQIQRTTISLVDTKTSIDLKLKNWQILRPSFWVKLTSSLYVSWSYGMILVVKVSLILFLTFSPKRIGKPTRNISFQKGWFESSLSMTRVRKAFLYH